MSILLAIISLCLDQNHSIKCEFTVPSIPIPFDGLQYLEVLVNILLTSTPLTSHKPSPYPVIRSTAREYFFQWEYSGTFQNITEYYRIFQNILKYSRIFQNIQKSISKEYCAYVSHGWELDNITLMPWASLAAALASASSAATICLLASTSLVSSWTMMISLSVSLLFSISLGCRAVSSDCITEIWKWDNQCLELGCAFSWSKGCKVLTEFNSHSIMR